MAVPIILPLSVTILSLSPNLVDSQFAIQQNAIIDSQLIGMLSGLNEKLALLESVFCDGVAWICLSKLAPTCFSSGG